jgi:leucyl aminopeptidase
MSIKINYSNRAINKSTANLVLFTDEKFNINSLRVYISNAEFSYINDLLKASDLKKICLFMSLIQRKK